MICVSVNSWYSAQYHFSWSSQTHLLIDIILWSYHTLLYFNERGWVWLEYWIKHAGTRLLLSQWSAMVLLSASFALLKWFRPRIVRGHRGVKDLLPFTVIPGKKKWVNTNCSSVAFLVWSSCLSFMKRPKMFCQHCIILLIVIHHHFVYTCVLTITYTQYVQYSLIF